ncbi:MAG: DUF4124 domain-containing protein [Candidatus Thiodiazotropha sp. (ex Ctena orbiculata)]|uniref:DUF4124 domain-containing protein n=1 Tax=Candidatus Thiodiazotropha taylori TaxID=2792791 RepID=A0A944M9G4_9GAMM|nr:DUF4124 domain-containing protein [Candidatus Thiodiazotropha taylori]MBT2989545.1 DUF4124 domain-containing protein [Candidatus Thiodiazotropha taylori]MBT2997125.1 DUF4124 domain-containing protein [Candidatus Thiodiazotropha taylori]MBT3001278.1 DUF4124 domain-containing protein [Candidatus Thiodiazotropha taylori]MBT3028971.1 DUF4124 domain-containing protein [Candidatus Thiodiazotropha taylori]
MERPKATALSLGLLLLLTAWPAYSGMYKWYDEQGKLNYTQTPPPPGSRRAPINTDTFSSVDMYKAPPITLNNSSRKRSKSKPVTIKKRQTRRTTRSTCPLQR